MPSYRSHQRTSSAGNRSGTGVTSSNCSHIVSAAVSGATLAALVGHHSAYHEKIRIPHTFMVHTYGIPTVCQYCKKLLRGLFKQGLQCRDCQYNAHKKCMDKVPHDCSGEKQHQFSAADYAESTPTHGTNKDRDHFFREEFDDSDGEDNLTTDFTTGRSGGYRHNNMMTTTTGTTMGTSATSSSRQTTQKTTTNAHNLPPELMNGLMSEDERAASYGDVRSAGEGQSLDGKSEKSSSSSSPSTNIPLMRIVQSVKHTKKRGGQAIKEGWLVHYTSLDRAVKRYFWRLDSKTITLFISDQGTKYHKEIPLGEIQAIESNRNLKVDLNFCFEIRTPSVNYYVGQDPCLLGGQREEQLVRLPPPDSGIGTDIAKSWETTIKQAYIHVTNTRKYKTNNAQCTLYVFSFMSLMFLFYKNYRMLRVRRKR